MSTTTLFDVMYYTTVIICIGIIIYILFKFDNNIFRFIFNRAIDESEFKPTVFKIYDKSSVDVCDRLIVIEPFNWVVWACRGNLYVLNPEGGIICGSSSTPAIHITSTKFIETCLKLNYFSIKDGYMNDVEPTIVPYTIENNRFTILTALNILVTKYITFNVNIESESKLYHPSLPKQKLSLYKLLNKRDTGRILNPTEIVELFKGKPKLTHKNIVKNIQTHYNNG